MSDALGFKTIIERKVTSSGHINEREFARRLMSQDEVMSLEPGKAIVFTPSTNPILLKSFAWQDYKDAIAYDPPDLRILEVDEQLKRRCEQEALKPEWEVEKEQKKFSNDEKSFRSPRRKDKRRQNNSNFQFQEPYSKQEKQEPKASEPMPESKPQEPEKPKQNKSGSPSRFEMPEGI